VIFVNYLDHIVNVIYQFGKLTLPDRFPMRQHIVKNQKTIEGVSIMPSAGRLMRLLHVDSSLLEHNSVSRKLSAVLIEKWRQSEPAIAVTYRDLAADPIAHLTRDVLQGETNKAPPTDEVQRDQALTEALIEEFLAADIIVIGAPMYNFSISSQLKAWIDRIVKAGRTFRYTATGPIGLAAGKRVVVVSSRGGVYTTPERRSWDFQENYLHLVFGFLGITDVVVFMSYGL
jgi:FMN-dependent NADH-azoreductase